MTRLYDRILAALTWIAAFAFASGVFLSLTLLFKSLPPTAPVAVGLVTVLRYSKLQDYVALGLFLLLVPLLTVWFHRLGVRFLPKRGALLFLVPFLFSPLFFLTTGKAGWVLALPVALAYAGPRALQFAQTRLWFRRMFRAELRPYHALLFCEALSWILFRYLVMGRRIAHIPTLFLELVFVALFFALFWAGAFLVARLAQLNFGADPEDVFRRITTGALPLVILPFIPLFDVPTGVPRAMTLIAMLLSAFLALRVRPLRPRSAWRLAAYLIIPALIYLVSYASTAQLSQWIDLFHRGESLGPASDYLRGKAPFRDVFALHGMLEDGQLDAWLMELFGRSVDVAIARTVVIGSLLAVSLWFLGLAVFESIPLALVCVAMGAWTTAENNRTFFQVAAVALFWIALKRRSRIAAIFSGVFAGVAVFFSYEIGLYTIVGAAACVAAAALGRRFVRGSGPGQETAPEAGAATLGFFLVGVLLGCAPFLVYLATRGALGAFFETSFVTIPHLIDAVWSLPFPDLVSTFRKDLNLHTLADFILFEKFHLILSPLTIAVALVYCIVRWMRRRIDTLDHALLVLTIFAAVTQRTAFGRAEFRHQYFSAFLIGPMLVLLALLLLRAVRGVWRQGGEGTRAFLAALGVATIPLLAVLFWIPDLVNARVDDVINYQRRQLHILRDGHAEEVAYRIQYVSEEIDRLTKPNDPIFDFSNQPAFYFFANRRNPTRFYQVPVLSPPEFQAETINVLQRTKPKVLIRKSPELFDQFDGIPNDLRAQALSAYLDDCYRFYRSVRGVELWTRKGDAKPLATAEYLKRIRIPREKEVVTSGLARLVFPAVGSVQGIGDSLWLSDLTMHNPFREPIRVTLRYVAGEVRVDRRLTLAARQTMRWPDVVRTFFGAPGSVGTLWIEYRETQAPVAVVKTYDAAHEGKAAVEQPLTARDAVSAESDVELALIGIPTASEIRRVNVGIVNTGTIPATFRISVRTRTGQSIGRTLEQGIAEDEVWLVTNLENALGVTLDETTTVRITPIAGTGVAFATIVGEHGDNEFIAAVPAQE